MYKLIFSIQNPLANESEQLSIAFEPDALNEAEWSAIFPLICGKIDAVQQRSMTTEPKKWADAVAEATAATAATPAPPG